MGEKFNDVKERYGGESLFAMLGTSRVWSMAGAMAFRQLFNTPNNIAAFEICKGPRHMATMMISEMAFSWQAIVEHPRVYVQWGGRVGDFQLRRFRAHDGRCREVGRLPYRG